MDTQQAALRRLRIRAHFMKSEADTALAKVAKDSGDVQAIALAADVCKALNKLSVYAAEKSAAEEAKGG